MGACGSRERNPQLRDWPAQLAAHKDGRLDLQKRGIRDRHAVALADALKGTSDVQHVHLGDNKIGFKGSIALADALTANPALSVNLVGNRIGSRNKKKPRFNEKAWAVIDGIPGDPYERVQGRHDDRVDSGESIA